MTLDDALKGMFVARKKLSSPEVVSNPSLISEHTYRLGQYTAEVERFLGEAEKEYEIKWAKKYSEYTVNVDPLGKGLSATAAKQQADVDTAEDKGNIKELTRLVGSSWKLHTGSMARYNHLQNEMRGAA